MLCEVCGAFEGELLVHCPGRKLSRDELQDCYSRKVVSIEYGRVIRARKALEEMRKYHD